MKQAVFRERNKRYYRVLHSPIWIWVFWVLPGYPLTYDLYAHGPDRRHWIWLAIVVAGVAWRGFKGRIPGCEPAPYIKHGGVDRHHRALRAEFHWADRGFYQRPLAAARSLPLRLLSIGAGGGSGDALRLDTARQTRHRGRGRRAGMVLRRDLDRGADPGHQLGRV